MWGSEKLHCHWTRIKVPNFVVVSALSWLPKEGGIVKDVGIVWPLLPKEKAIYPL